MSAFLDGRLGFTAIADVIRTSMDEFESHGASPVTGLADVRAIDDWTRGFATNATARLQTAS